MNKIIDPKFFRFLKKNRPEIEPAEQSINRIREIAARHVVEKTKKTIPMYYYGVALAAIVLIAFTFSSLFNNNTETLIALNSNLSEELIELDESIQSIYESIDDDLVLLTDNESLTDDISDISVDINQILDEF